MPGGHFTPSSSASAWEGAEGGEKDDNVPGESELHEEIEEKEEDEEEGEEGMEEQEHEVERNVEQRWGKSGRRQGREGQRPLPLASPPEVARPQIHNQTKPETVSCIREANKTRSENMTQRPTISDSTERAQTTPPDTGQGD